MKRAIELDGESGMSDHAVSKDRRRFLSGVGGATLALPVLPSLFSAKEAQAQMAGSKCLATFMTPHGGLGQLRS